MKRSEVNGIMHAADAFFRSNNFYLPPFAYWSPQEWKKRGEEVSEIVDRRPIDITSQDVCSVVARVDSQVTAVFTRRNLA